MSHIDKAFEAKHVITRGKTKKVMIQPLGDAPVQVVAPDKITAAVTAINNATDTKTLDAIEKHAASLGIDQTAEIQAALITKRGELEGPI